MGIRVHLPLPVSFPFPFALPVDRCGPVEDAIWPGRLAPSPCGIAVSELDPDETIWSRLGSRKPGVHGCWHCHTTAKGEWPVKIDPKEYYSLMLPAVGRSTGEIGSVARPLPLLSQARHWVRRPCATNGWSRVMYRGFSATAHVSVESDHEGEQSSLGRGYDRHLPPQDGAGTAEGSVPDGRGVHGLA